MITQDFLMEYELLLIRSFNKAQRTAPLTSGAGGNFLNAAQARNAFLSAFNEAFTGEFPSLERKLLRLGYNNPTFITTGLQKEVHTQLSATLFQKDNKLDVRSFQRLAQKLKDDVRFKY